MRGMISGAAMLLTTVSLVVSGCSSTAVTAKEYSQPREMMAAAEQAGASKNNDASLHLQYARENLAKADELIKDEKFDKARHYLVMAEADAEVALALAEGEQLRAQVMELDERIKKVKGDTL